MQRRDHLRTVLCILLSLLFVFPLFVIPIGAAQESPLHRGGNGCLLLSSANGGSRACKERKHAIAGRSYGQAAGGTDLL